MQSSVRHILFLTSTSLSVNPRCLKEVRAALANGYNVTVISFNLGKWIRERDMELRQDLTKVNFYDLDATRKNFRSWLFASLTEKICRAIWTFNKSNITLCAYAQSKRAIQLSWFLKAERISPDLIIAHNPPAFYPAMSYAGKLGIPFGIDIEDFHPGEEKTPRLNEIISYLMKGILPKACYVSFASPLIKEYSLKLIPDLAGKDLPVINNVFSKEEFYFHKESDNAEGLNIVWFSQNINYGRGLELIIPALDEFQTEINLFLIGAPSELFYNEYLAKRSYIKVIKPLSQTALHKFLCSMDIGLAIEDSNADLNRDLCLTNKIWAYFQAGLYIIVSSTSAQKNFIREYSDHGCIVELKKENLIQGFKKIIQEHTLIRNGKAGRFEFAGSINWESESNKLTDIWNRFFK